MPRAQFLAAEKPRRLLFAAVAAALVVLTLGAGKADAQTPAETYALEFQLSGFSQCTGERIDFTVSIHGVIRESEDSGHFVMNESFTFRGESESGVRYIGAGVEMTSIQAEGGFAGDSTIVFTDQNSQSLVAQGEQSDADDLVSTAIIHRTLNADGEMTAEVISIHSECR